MKKSKLSVLSLALPLGLGLSLTLAACGGSDSDGNGNSSGASSGGTKSTTTGGTSSSAAGTTNKAGSTGSGDTAGTGGKATTPGNGTDVPGDTPLSDLTDDQFDQLCKDFADKFSGETFDETGCRLTSVLATLTAQTDEQAQELCKTAYDECKATPPDTTDSCEKPGADCTATVDEMNACLDDASGVFASLGDALPSCDTLKRSDVLALFTQFGGMTDIASCTTYQEKCPDGPQAPSAGAMP